MRNDTIPDWQSRVRIARMESEEFLKPIRMMGWVLALSSGGIIAAAGYYGAPLWALIALGCLFTSLMLSGFALLLAHRSYVQKAFAEMTLSHVESELEVMRRQLDSVESDVSELRRSSRGPSWS